MPRRVDFRLLQRYLLFLLLLCMGNKVSAQHSNIFLTFRPTLFGHPVALDSMYRVGGDSISIESLKWYVHGLTLYHNDTPVANADQQYHLIDLDRPESMTVGCTRISDKPINRLRFFVGVDSLTNASGAMGGALDPMHGMYWSWQSGYIHFKCEGRSTKCATRHQRYQYHIGGFTAPWNTIRIVDISIDDLTELIVDMAMERLMDFSEPGTACEIMSPGPEAAAMADRMQQIFSLSR